MPPERQPRNLPTCRRAGHRPRARTILGFAAAVLWTGAAAAALEIPVTIEELLPVGTAGTARSGAPLRFGVPLPETAQVDSTTPVALDGFPTPQVRPLHKDASGRWRWMLVETLADLQAGERRTTTLRLGSGGYASGAALASDAGEAIQVQAGGATFRIRKLGWNGIDAATSGGTTWIATGHAGGLAVADTNGVVYRSANDTAGSVAIETNGPLLATVVARGWLRSTGGTALFAYTARLRFARDRAEVELELTLQNAEIARLQPVRLRWAKFELPIAAGATPAVAFGLNGAPVATALDSAAAALVLYQGRTDFREDSKTNSYVRARMTDDVGVLATQPAVLRGLGTLADHLDGWLAVGGAGGLDDVTDMCFAVRDLAPLYPTGMRLGAADASGTRLLSYDILSPVNSRAAPLVWAWGAHHTGTAVVAFGATPRATHTQAQFPVFGRADFEWVRASGGLYGETRLVDLATEQAWFLAQGRNYTTSPPTYANLDVRRYYDFGSTGGPNQYDENLTYVIDYLRAGQTARLLQALQDAAWKSDQAVMHSDDFDYGTRAYGETDVDVSDPDGWNGRGRNTTFENEHPHWLTLPVLYWMTGNERLREAAVDYCEWRRYKAGNHSYGPIYGKGMSSLRLWSRAWRDIALAWEFTHQQRYYDDMVRMTRAVVDSRESPGVRGRNLTRGYLYIGDWGSAARPIRLFFLDAIHGTDARESYRLLPDGALREDFRDYLVGLAYFTLEARLGANQSGYPYTYNLDAATDPGTRGDQIGMLMAHGYEWTGDATFNDYGRGLAWRTIVDEDWERGSEPATLIRCWSDLNAGARGIGWVEDRQVTRQGSTATLTWTAPAGATSYVVKYAAKPLVPHVWFDAVARTYRHDPAQYANFWAATNVQGEPAPGAAGTPETMTITGLDPAATLHFAVRYTTTAPVVPAIAPPGALAATYDAEGRVQLSWTPPADASAVRVVCNDAAYAGFAYGPNDGTALAVSGTTAIDSNTGFSGTVARGRTLYYSAFARTAGGSWSAGARLAVTYAPPGAPPVVTAAAAPVAGEAPCAVAFTGMATDADGDLASVSWDFGDGSAPSASAEVAHVYTSAGSFTARFTAIDASGRSRSATVEIAVSQAAAPEIALSASPTSGRAPRSVRFAASVQDASALADTFWVFAGGDTVHATALTRVLATGGRHAGRFHAVDVHGLASEDSVVVTLLPPDAEPPGFASIAPAPGATGVARATAIAVTLADSTSGILADSLVFQVNGVPVSPQIATSGSTTLAATYQPSQPFGYGETVRVRVRLVDRATPPNVADSTWTFTTDADATPPVLAERTPEPGARGVDPQAEILLFLEDAQSGVAPGSIRLRVGGQTVTAEVEAVDGGWTVHWAPAVPFAYAATVGVELRATDRATTPNVIEASWSFQVAIEPVRVDFHTASFATPAGWRADVGAVYDAVRRYGWSARVATETAGTTTLDPRVRSYAYVTNSAPATWQLALPAGRYAVSLVVGSPANTGLHRVEVEGALVVNNVATGAGQTYAVNGRVVEVQDGFLTVKIGGIAKNTKKTKLCWLEVRSAAPDAGTGREASPNQAPIVEATATPAAGTAPLVVAFAAGASDADGDALTYAWAFGDGGTAASGSTSHTYTAAGRYTVVVTATDVHAASTRDTLLVTVTEPPAVTRVNFQPASFVTPPGYVADTGLAFDATRRYGWSARVSTEVAGPVTLAPQVRSYAYVTNSAPAVWQLVVPRGRWLVSLEVGSPAYTGLHRVEVEGTVFVNDVATGAGQTVTVPNREVTVEDGMLSVRLGGIAGNTKKTKLCWIEVRAASGATLAAESPDREPEPRGRAWCIDFQPARRLAPLGARIDTGAPFDPARGYGWLERVATRQGGAHLDARNETQAEIVNPRRGTWQLALPAGTYAVTLVAGSPVAPGVQSIEIEGRPAVLRVPTRAGEYHALRGWRVQVEDGYLTVDAGGVEGTRRTTQLCWIDVRPAASVEEVPVPGRDGASERDTLETVAPAAGADEAWASGGRLRLDFQPRDVATEPGWIASSGEAFERARGFGWDHRVRTGRARTNLGARRNSYVEIDNDRPATFSVLVPNGRYRVWLVAGSPAHDGRHRVEIEGLPGLRDVPTRPGGFAEVAALEVEVQDGALNVVAGGGDGRGTTKLCSLEIEKVAASGSVPAVAAGLRCVRGTAVRASAPMLEIATPAPARLRLAVYDARGRRVRLLHDAPIAAGTLRLAWDGRDESGRTAAAGVYFARADLDRRTFTAKVLLVR